MDPFGLQYNHRSDNSTTTPTPPPSTPTTWNSFDAATDPFEDVTLRALKVPPSYARSPVQGRPLRINTKKNTLSRTSSSPLDSPAPIFHATSMVDDHTSGDDDDDNGGTDETNPFDTLEAWIPSSNSNHRLAPAPAAAAPAISNEDEDDDDLPPRRVDFDSTSGPAIPSRPVFAKELVARYTMDPNTFTTQPPLLAFITSPVDQPVHFVFEFDPMPRIYKLIHPGSQRLILLAHKRTDRLKALSLSSNFSICAVPDPVMMQNAARDNDKPGPFRIAKLRGNTLGSKYVLFDNGKNPETSKGALETRRELAAFSFHNVPGIYSRRNTMAYLPNGQAAIRRASMVITDGLEARGKARDPNVLVLVGYMPGTSSQVPLLGHYGSYATYNSVKNFILHDPFKADNGIHVLMGKLEKYRFNLLVHASMSPLQAFACAIASMDSKVKPQYQ